ncbi:LAQU0S33e00144g1_1 [Lachancea quebecensis]|uniref:LAQU0S33e00144g1_1 n=1 Tax=Lachancea quebecensis TaxID=1654605 RepID=A0A0P1KYK1_9SACH|nr:LAQU0S33e00144g1_1 [Lachancea quebecensis]
MSFNSSRRSVVHSTKGIVTCSQPLAAAAGVKVLELGGNSIDASIAVSACLCVLEPASTGVAGDCFLLHFNASTKEVIGLNGTGRTPSKLSREWLIENGAVDPSASRLSPTSVHAITVPGAVAGWVDAFTRLGSGKVSLEQILQPAIDLSENGHPISEISAYLVQTCWDRLQKQNEDAPELLNCFAPLNNPGQPPKDGDFVVNRQLAKVFRAIAKNGKEGFYNGEIADAIVDEIARRGGILSKQDLANHTSTFVDAIYLDVLGHRIWEIPPNSQGLVALLALGIIQELHEEGIVDLYTLKQNSPEYLHLITECLKIAFYDSDEYVSDPCYQEADILDKLLSKEYLRARAKLFGKDSILDSSKMRHGVPDASLNQSDTVYFTVSDSNGNATSFINSVYVEFGSAIVPRKFGGFVMHNRGSNFNLTKGSKNCLEPNKRPYHTIIPSMITDPKTGDLEYSFGNMGGFMQPTGHVQHFLNLILFQLSPQESLDKPRICLSPHPKCLHLDRGLGSNGPVSTPVTLVSVEDDLEAETVNNLRSLGHDVEVVTGMNRSLFGRGQIIKKTNLFNNQGFLYSAGSDKRGDGCAIPLI